MEYLVIDDTWSDVTLLVYNMNLAFPDARDVGESSRTFKNWEDVHKEILSRTCETDELVLFLDLSILPSNTMAPRDAADVAATIELTKIRAARPMATLIAYTQYPEIARRRGSYDGILDKGSWGGLPPQDERTRKLRVTVMTAIGKQKKQGGGEIEKNHELLDSLGIRLVEAAFGESFFNALVVENAEGWINVEIRAMTSGHSGAFVLRLSGTVDGQTRSLIIKCARESKTLDSEMLAVEKYRDRLGELAGHMNIVEQKSHELSDFNCFYLCQPLITGVPIIEVLKNEAWGDETLKLLSGLTDIERSHYDQSQIFVVRKPLDIFPLSPKDKKRAEDSLSFLFDISSAVQAQGAWPKGAPGPGIAVEKVGRVIQQWATIMEAEAPLQCITQHGDLNPGNLIVQKSGQVVLIDLERLGDWPVGYDLCRLATMLRLRLTDSKQNCDWVSNNIQAWFDEGFCTIDSIVQPQGSICPSAVYCDQVFRDLLESRSDEEKTLLRRGYLMSTLFDMIKVLSYIDLSPFKKIWTLLTCWKLVEELDLSVHNESEHEADCDADA